MPWWGITLIVLGAILIIALVLLFIFGRKMQTRQAEAEKQMELTKQQVSILVIDKQKKKMTEAGLPEAVVKEAPAYARRMKLPVVKAKIGPRVMTLIADAKVYEILPVKKTCTVMMSGIYITELKSVRGGSVPKLPEKKGLMQKLRKKAEDLRAKKN
ncbi:MAG: hypothetical protein IJL78_00995 [Lachnospiraceae bacterium]|nr:hypothetical protein [Lachnospiraceae bacterium]